MTLLSVLLHPLAFALYLFLIVGFIVLILCDRQNKKNAANPNYIPYTGNAAERDVY